jgi:hypothetical protein
MRLRYFVDTSVGHIRDRIDRSFHEQKVSESLENIYQKTIKESQKYVENEPSSYRMEYGSLSPLTKTKFEMEMKEKNDELSMKNHEPDSLSPSQLIEFSEIIRVFGQDLTQRLISKQFLFKESAMKQIIEQLISSNIDQNVSFEYNSSKFFLLRKKNFFFLYRTI